MDHAFKGTRFPWNKERMEFILNELISKHKKYKTYTKLIEVYIILAEKIGATPRIVENFIKNLGRDYREWMKMHPECDRDSIKLRGSNKIFKLFEEYNRLYNHEDPPNVFPPPKMSEYTLDEQDRLIQIPEGEDEVDTSDDDIPQFLEVIEVDSGVKEEPEDVQIMSVRSMSSQAKSSNADDEPSSPTPPPPPLPRVPRAQGRRMMTGSRQGHSSSTVLRQQEQGLQDVVSMSSDMTQLQHITSPSSGQVQSHVPTNVNTSVATQGLLSTMSSLPSLVQHPPFHLPTGTASSSGIGSHYIPLHVIQNGPAPTTAYTAQSSVALEDLPNSVPATSNKRPMKSQNDNQQQHSSKRNRTSSMPLVAENLPSSGMTEFERRYLQGMDTQNKMLSDIGRELKLLRTGFYAIHSDEIADMVNPNMH